MPEEGTGPGEVDDAEKLDLTLTLSAVDDEYPGDTASGYEVSFEADEDYTPFEGTIEIMMEEFGVPSSIIESRVTISKGGSAVNPEGVTVDGTTVTLTVPDLDTSASGEEGIKDGDTVTIVFLSAAAIKTPVYSGDYNWVVEGIETGDIAVDGEEPLVVPPPVVDDGLPSFEQSSNDPADSANYTVKFQLIEAVNTRRNDLIIEFHDDYGMPATMRNTSVTITTDVILDAPRPPGDVTFTPEDVTVDGQKVLISLGDVDERDDKSQYDFAGTEEITVHFRQSAGITNPTEAKGYNLVGIEFGGTGFEYEEEKFDEEYGDEDANHPMLKSSVVRKISLSEEDGGLNDPVDATGKGFKNGTTLTVFVDQPTNVMWDNDNDDETGMVLLTFDSAADATAQGRSMYTNNWADYKAAIADEDRDVKMNVQVVDSATDNAGVERPLFMVAHPDATATSPRARVVQGPNGSLQLGEDVSCIVSAIGSDD